MKKIIIISGAVIAVGIAAYFILSGSKAPSYTFVTAKKGELIQEVSVTGKVKAAQSVDLAFEKAGRVAKVLADVNDQVAAGQILVQLENGDTSAQLLQAQASLESEKAKLAEMQKGTRPEEIQQAEVSVANAQKSLDDAQTKLDIVKSKADSDIGNLYNSIPNILQDAYTKADDAINKQTSSMFTNDFSANPQLSFSVSDLQTQSDSQSQRLLSRSNLTDFKSEITNLSTDHSALDLELTKAENHLTVIRNFLVRLLDAVNAAINLPTATSDAYKTNISTARTNINTALTSITAQEQAIATQKLTNQTSVSAADSQVNDAKSSLASAQANLNLLKAGSTPDQIASQQAIVKAAQANVENFQAQVNKTILRSPIAGIVTAQNAKVGQIVSVNASVVSVISNKFQAEAYVPEADIAKVKVGDEASITLDAYGEDVIFNAKVIKIDAGGTIIEGVATYKVTMEFAANDARLKPELTANIDILTAKLENVIAVPQRAVIEKSGGKFVTILAAGGTTKDVPVKTGIKSSTGTVEITEGLNEGDKVIIF